MRWLLLIGAAVVTLKMLIRWLNKDRFSTLDERLSLGYPVILDVQTLRGILL